MKVTILGCGGSGGVPMIGNNWGKCDPNNPRNRRLRSSIFIEKGATTILVDTSPDLRQQCLNHSISKFDGIIYTHAHADHTHGIDELLTFNWLTQKPIEVYADAATMTELSERFRYIFRNVGGSNFIRPSVNPHIIDGAFSIKDVAVKSFKQHHGAVQSLGLRIGDFAYSTDVKKLDEDAFAVLKGVKTWIVDCVTDEEAPTHAHLALALEWIERLKPERAFLTHMSQRLDYDTLMRTLPLGVEPCYDGLVIEC